MAQSLVPRQTGDLMFPQDASQGLAQHTQAKLEAVRNLVGMGIREYDLMYGQMKAYVEGGGGGGGGGRSPDHQRYIAERAASLLATHNIAVGTIIRGAISDTRDNRYVKEVSVPRIIEVPRQGILPRLFGR
jgi:hypothetical protein